MGMAGASECDVQHTGRRINGAIPMAAESFPAIHAGFTDDGEMGRI